MTGPDSEGLQALPASMVPSAGSIDAISNYDPDERAPVVPSVGAVPVEVPEDVRQAINAVLEKWLDLNPSGLARTLARAAYPLIAAQVRRDVEDGQPCTTCDEPTGNPDTFCDACKLSDLEEECDRLRAEVARVRAEERQRAAGMVQRFFRHSPTTDWAAVIDLTNSILAAGSAVPAATREPLDFEALAVEALAGIKAAYTAAGKDVESEAFRMHLAGKVAEEGAEALAAYLHVTGWARRPGTWEQFDAELADTVISAFLAAVVNGRDLNAAIAAKHAVVMSRGFKEPVATPTVPVDEAVCPNCEQTIRARMSDAPADQDSQATVALTRDGLDGGWVAVLSAPPGCMSQGETIPAALRNLAGAAAEVAEVAAALALAEQDGQR